MSFGFFCQLISQTNMDLCPDRLNATGILQTSDGNIIISWNVVKVVDKSACTVGSIPIFGPSSSYETHILSLNSKYEKNKEFGKNGKVVIERGLNAPGLMSSALFKPIEINSELMFPYIEDGYLNLLKVSKSGSIDDVKGSLLLPNCNNAFFHDTVRQCINLNGMSKFDNDKILVFGYHEISGPNHNLSGACLFVINSVGQIDNTFGTNGIATFPEAAVQSCYVNDNHIFLFGNGLIMVLNGDGSLCEKFGDFGKFIDKDIDFGRNRPWFIGGLNSKGVHYVFSSTYDDVGITLFNFRHKYTISNSLKMIPFVMDIDRKYFDESWKLTLLPPKFDKNDNMILSATTTLNKSKNQIFSLLPSGKLNKKFANNGVFEFKLKAAPEKNYNIDDLIVLGNGDIATLITGQYSKYDFGDCSHCKIWLYLINKHGENNLDFNTNGHKLLFSVD